MSQASDLLNGLSGDDIVAPVSVAEKEHVVVGEDRFIRVPDSLMRLGVQHDKDIETVTFDCPRHWGKHDLSSMQIYINYVLPNGEDGRCPVSNLSTTGTKMYFDWTISDYVTQYNGKISFLICAVTVDAEGNEALHWNSELNQECYISEGLECRESTIHKYPDIVTHLLTRMKEVEAIATPEAMQTYTDTWLEANRDRILAEIEAKGAATLATIPDDYTETYNMAKESVRTKADTIVCTAQGELITASDSSDDHIRNLRVFGKTEQAKTTGAQLFNPYAAQNNSFGNATVENNGARITVTGTYYVSWPLVLKAGVTYYINFETVGAAANRAIRFEYPDKEITGTVTNPASFTPTKDTVSVYLYAGLGTEGTIIYENVQISEGPSAIPWEPYSGGMASPSPDWPQPLVNVENPTVAVHGKNLFDPSKLLAAAGWTENNGVYSGRSSAVHDVYNYSTGIPLIDVFKPNTRYIMSFYCRVEADADKTGVTFTFKYDDGTTTSIYPGSITGKQESFISVSGKTVVGLYASYGSDLKVHLSDVQLEEGYSITEYEPYSGGSIELTRVIHGIPVTSGGNYTDANGQQWICDEIDFKRGVYIRRIGEVVIDGTVAPTVFSPGTNGGSAFGFNYSHIGIDDILRDRCPKLCDKLLPMPDATIASWKLCEIGRWGFNTDGSADNFLIMNVGEFESAEAVQTWLTSNPITFQYILRTPIEIPLAAEELETFKALKTNYRHTTVLNDAGAHMELVYNADTKTYVDNGIKKSVTDVLEAIENGFY